MCKCGFQSSWMIIEAQWVFTAGNTKKAEISWIIYIFVPDIVDKKLFWFDIQIKKKTVLI
jgi:hypothetical protein